MSSTTTHVFVAIAAIVAALTLAALLLAPGCAAGESFAAEAQTIQQLAVDVNKAQSNLYDHLVKTSVEVDGLQKDKAERLDQIAQIERLRGEVRDLLPAVRRELQGTFVDRGHLDQRLADTVSVAIKSLAPYDYVDAKFATLDQLQTAHSTVTQEAGAAKHVADRALSLAEAAAPQSYVDSTFALASNVRDLAAELRTDTSQRAKASDLDGLERKVQAGMLDMQTHADAIRAEIRQQNYMTRQQADASYAMRSDVERLDSVVGQAAAAYRGYLRTALSSGQTTPQTAMLQDIDARTSALRTDIDNMAGAMLGIGERHIDKSALVVGGRFQLSAAETGRLGLYQPGVATGLTGGFEAEELHAASQLVSDRQALLRGAVVLGDVERGRSALVRGLAEADITGSLRVRGTDSTSRIDGTLMVDGGLIVRGTRIDPQHIDQLDKRLAVIEQRMRDNMPTTAFA